MNRKNFIIIGVAGFVAVRHLRAIHELNHNLIAAMDPNDSVGVIDSYFPSAYFFTEIERLDRYIEKVKSQGVIIDYFVICSPNYLHDAHIRFGLKHGADVICEKPLVLNPWNVESLKNLEQETGKKVYNILQMRLHPEVQKIKKYTQQYSKVNKGTFVLSYVAPRGYWYHASWKGDKSKSGGIVTNIGVHMFDLLLSLFGPPESLNVYVNNHSRAVGSLKFNTANVDWFLSIEDDLAIDNLPSKNNSIRCLQIENEIFSFSNTFADLHTESYVAILSGSGFTIGDALPAIEIVHSINRISEMDSIDQSTHPLIHLPQKDHPFS